VKAISVKQPFAFLISTGSQAIEVRSWSTPYRGDLVVCASSQPALHRREMKEIEDDWGFTFLYGQALCVVRLADVRRMRKGDEALAGMVEIDPEAYSWVLEDIRPIVPFPLKGKRGLFDVDDTLIHLPPFKLDDPVVIRTEAVDEDFGFDFNGCQGRVVLIDPTEAGDFILNVALDSISLESIPASIIKRCEQEGYDWTAIDLHPGQVRLCEPRDTWQDVIRTIETIVRSNPEIFGEVPSEED